MLQELDAEMTKSLSAKDEMIMKLQKEVASALEMAPGGGLPGNIHADLESNDKNLTDIRRLLDNANHEKQNLQNVVDNLQVRIAEQDEVMADMNAEMEEVRRELYQATRNSNQKKRKVKSKLRRSEEKLCP